MMPLGSAGGSQDTSSDCGELTTTLISAGEPGAGTQYHCVSYFCTCSKLTSAVLRLVITYCSLMSAIYKSTLLTADRVYTTERKNIS